MKTKISILILLVVGISASLLVTKEGKVATNTESILETTVNSQILPSGANNGPQNVRDVYSVKLVTSEQKKDYAVMSAEVQMELRKLGSTSRKALQDAKDDYQRYCSDLGQIDERINELDIIRGEKLAALDTTQDQGPAIAKIIHDHLYEIQFLAIVKSQCQSKQG